MTPALEVYETCANFSDWLLQQVISDGRGDHIGQLDVPPDGRFWLGRLATEESVRNNPLGARGERLDPCEVGFRVRLRSFENVRIRADVRARAWRRVGAGAGPATMWVKTAAIDVTCTVVAPTVPGPATIAGADEIDQAFRAIGADGLKGEVHAETVLGRDGLELVLTVVNTSPEAVQGGLIDSRFYEVVLVCEVPDTEPFMLDALPDSFRYDRRVAAYGINCGVEQPELGVFRTSDVVIADRLRPRYWDDELGDMPDMRFHSLAGDPLPSLEALVAAGRAWAENHWALDVLRARADEEGWNELMLEQAEEQSTKFREEITRVEEGTRLLRRDAELLRSFRLMNASFVRASGGKYDAWRPFQLGFIVAVLNSLNAANAEMESEIVDTLWFATGGGKTETYLGLLVTAAFYDRLTGKGEGITAWARFPLRMLSLQQTQRFADAFAAAELIRQEEQIEGEPFSVGFLVGPGTPNDIPLEPKPGQPDVTDPDMPSRYQVLLYCPFCRNERIEMHFDRDRWMLDHICRNRDCAWRGPLPFRVVDKEIYRVLPTVIVGTIDKVANVSMQAAMRGFYAAPYGICPLPNHGFTYAPRSANPSGCQFPACTATPRSLNQPATSYAPRLRIQDELHLLRDSLGAIDTHYEALLDHLQDFFGARAKIAASSATLAGHDQQVEALYRRTGRLFPMPGPAEGRSFWSVDDVLRARRFVGVAPRGVTLEFAADRINETLQRSIRRALTEPDVVAAAADVPTTTLPLMVSLYGVDVTYGSTLRDVEAVARSFETELRVEPLNSVSLTGRTPLDEVRDALHRLNAPEPEFGDRIHLIAASSMLSHGVDVDRLNVMVMLGLPLSTAEFIQTTSRVGRTYPGLVVVIHKIGRERDAAVHRSFPQFIRHADRFVDAVPITRKSRRVLELTFPGLFLGRAYGLHEPQAIARGVGRITTLQWIRRVYQQLPVLEDAELQALIAALDAHGPLDDGLRRDLERWMRDSYRALNDPATEGKWPNDIFPMEGPMKSLRDVEQQIPVYSRGGDA
jgi:hypothetical protein